MNDKKQFADHFMLTCLAYEKEFNPEMAKLYFSDLKEFTDYDVVSAFSQHRKDPDRGRFFPKVADIIFQIQKLSRAIDARQLAELEWSKVLRAAAKGLKPKDATPEAIGALQITGGVKVIGYAEVPELARLRKTFIDSFTALQDCKASEVPEHLENALEIKNKKQQVAVRD